MLGSQQPSSPAAQEEEGEGGMEAMLHIMDAVLRFTWIDGWMMVDGPMANLFVGKEYECLQPQSRRPGSLPSSPSHVFSFSFLRPFDSQAARGPGPAAAAGQDRGEVEWKPKAACTDLVPGLEMFKRTVSDLCICVLRRHGLVQKGCDPVAGDME